jgi:hypothetical protein
MAECGGDRSNGYEQGKISTDDHPVPLKGEYALVNPTADSCVCYFTSSKIPLKENAALPLVAGKGGSVEELL